VERCENACRTTRRRSDCTRRPFQQDYRSRGKAREGGRGGRGVSMSDVIIPFLPPSLPPSLPWQYY